VSESADELTRQPVRQRRGTRFPPGRLLFMADNDLHSRCGSIVGVWAAVVLAGGAMTHCFAQQPALDSQVAEQSPAQELKNTQANRDAEKRKHHPVDITARCQKPVYHSSL